MTLSRGLRAGCAASPSNSSATRQLPRPRLSVAGRRSGRGVLCSWGGGTGSSLATCRSRPGSSKARAARAEAASRSASPKSWEGGGRRRRRPRRRRPILAPASQRHRCRRRSRLRWGAIRSGSPRGDSVSRHRPIGRPPRRPRPPCRPSHPRRWRRGRRRFPRRRRGRAWPWTRLRGR